MRRCYSFAESDGLQVLQVFFFSFSLCNISTDRLTLFTTTYYHLPLTVQFNQQLTSVELLVPQLETLHITEAYAIINIIWTEQEMYSHNFSVHWT